jgi:SAM-dependent methyltransferase
MHIDGIKRNWNAFGRKDPYWAILTHPGKQGGKWEIDEFYQTGKNEIDLMMDYATSLGLRIKPGRALDFGCGVGRLTQALAPHFRQVIGVDIARSMLKTARKYNRVGKRCRYILNETDNLKRFQDGYFDFVYSNIVLQHMEPRYCKRYLAEFVRILARRGILIFQLPSRIADESAAQRSAEPPLDLKQEDSTVVTTKQPRRVPKGRKNNAHREPVMEMYTIPRDEVVRALNENGARVVDISENDFSGPGFVSLRYCVVKDGRI